MWLSVLKGTPDERRRNTSRRHDPRAAAREPTSCARPNTSSGPTRNSSGRSPCSIWPSRCCSFSRDSSPSAPPRSLPVGGVILMSVTSILAIVNCLLLIKTKTWLHRLNEAWLGPQEKVALTSLRSQRTRTPHPRDQHPRRSPKRRAELAYPWEVNLRPGPDWGVLLRR